ncbi:MAG: hypothetical protein IKB90_00545 [Alistipes sp.]|nr:hypothetical protein [Alistipes sp.]
MTKIFMAVAVAMLAFACVTDTTEDLGLQVGNGENGLTVELSLSLEESRTQLGEKVDGIYPLYWSEGDKISVNGVASGEAVINESNPASATFAVQEAESYAVAYPAASEGQVLFAEKQNHVAEGDTFASGVSTMYGYGTDRNAIQLNHLTGVLKVGIKGEATLAKAQISTIDRAPIAGAFDIDFATGELTATTASKDVIEYSFGEAGLQLSSEAQYIYVAVPAGKYDELYITLYEQGNSGNIMYATVKAGDAKPLTAGNVREFKSAITYAPNAQLYVINSVERLQAFKAAIESEEGLASDALLTEDIDMTDVEWTPIAGESYVNTLIGNGYAIKSLTAPLFATTSASFKGVHLEDVNIATNDRPTCGALACTITSTDAVTPKVENCSVSGTFTVKNDNLAATASVRYGALLGYVCGAEINGCQNYATVTSEVLYASSEQPVHLGGIVGSMGIFTKSDATVLYSKIYNSTNNGAVTGGAACKGTSYIGGVVGCSIDKNIGIVISSCTNNGAVSLTSTTVALNIGGVCGYAISNGELGLVSEVKNYGGVTIKSGASATGDSQVGGLFGTCRSLPLSDSYNKGTVHAEEGAKMAGVNMGSIFGLNTYINGNKKGPTTNTTNDGEVKFGASNNSATSANTTRIGGIVGYGQSRLTNIVNNGKITIYGTRNANGTISQASNAFRSGSYVIAGIAGYKTEGAIDNCSNHGDIEIAGTFKELHATNKTEWKIAGICSYLSTNLVGSCVCDGEIIVSGTIEGEANIGGKIAFTYADQDSETSNTNITIKKGAVLSGGAIIGGVICWTSMVTENHCTYKGTITIEEGATIGTKCYIGGCVGMFLGIKSSSAKTAKNMKNHGAILNNGTLTNGGFIGGTLGYAKAAADASYTDKDGNTTTYKNCKAHIINNATNSGTVSCGPKSVTTGTNLYVGGIAGHSAGVTTATNSGKITIDGSHTGGNNYFAGCIADGTGDATGLTNNANIECPATAKFKVARMGGLVGYNSYKVSGTNLGCINYAATSTGSISIGGIAYRGIVIDCVNGVDGDATKGVINYNGAAGSAATSGSINFGGIVCDPHGSCSNSTNYAPINIGGSSSHTIYGGGIGYGPVDEGETMTNCQNYGKITISTKAGIPGNADRKGADCFVGGFAYNTSTSEKTHTYVNCHNHGDIELAPEAEIAGAIRLGGMIGNIEDKTAMLTLDGCSNTGNIKISAKCSLGESSNCIIAGCISSCTSSGGTLVVKNGLTNKGNITVDGENTRNYVSIGGIFGTTGAGVTFNLSGNIVNTGELTFSGKAKTYLRIGGIVSAHSAASFTAPMISTGNITVTGTCDLANASTQIGGITAAHSNPVTNAQYYGNIKAIGYPNVGMITGKAYADAILVSNSAIGGTITATTKNVVDANGDEDTIPMTITLSETSNVDDDQATEWNDYWYKYIYGSGNAESLATTNNVTLLTSAPSTEQPAPDVTPEETPEA